MQDESERRELLGAYVAPEGLYAAIKARPFLGSVRCSHDRLVAGSWHEIVLTYEVGACGIADGATFKATFKFYSDWALFQTADPSAANYVSAEYEAGPLLPGQSPATVQSLSVRFDQKGHERPFQKAVIVDVIDGYLNAGDRIVIRLGDRRAGGPGTRVQTFVEDGFRFRCYVDPLGTSRYVAVPNDPVIAVVAGPPERVQIGAPRFVAEGVAPPVTAALLDRWGNVARDCGGSLDVTAFSGEREVYARRHELPAEGWACLRIEDLPAVSGALRIAAAHEGSEGVAYVTGLPDAPVPRALYGDLHVHAHDTVGTNSPPTTRPMPATWRASMSTATPPTTSRSPTRAGARASRSPRASTRPAASSPTRCRNGAAARPRAATIKCCSSATTRRASPSTRGRAQPHLPVEREHGEHRRRGRALAGRGSVGGLRARSGEPPRHPACRRAPLHPGLAPSRTGAPRRDRLGLGPVRLALPGRDRPRLSARRLRQRRRASRAPRRRRAGVQVFGVRGGLTGILADSLDRRAVGRALRARHTFATTGERSALLVTCGPHRQGDAFAHEGPARLDYRFLGDAGFEELTAHDHTGEIWRRDLHAELGFSQRLVRLRFGGARIRDRYRWAAWEGRIRILNGTIRRVATQGFEHPEETAWRAGPTEIAFRSETYGDSDTIEIDIGDLRECRIRVEGTIGGFVKVGDPRRPAPFVHVPDFSWEITGRELIASGALRRDLGGAGLFLALERMTEAPLPRDVAGHITVEPQNAAFGFRPVYFSGRQRDGSRVWSSAQFIAFATAAPRGEAG